MFVKPRPALQLGSQTVAALHRSRSYSSNPFPVLKSEGKRAISPANKENNLQLYNTLLAQRQSVLSVSKAEVGGAKLGVRERLALLRDDDSDILEIGLLAGLDMSYGDVPCGGNVVCVVEVCGVKCVVTASDWTVKGGCSFPITLKKQLRAQEIALQNRLPCIYLIDSGGAFLPLQSEIYPDKEHGGRVFRNEAVLSSLSIPQVAVVTGSCTAGGAYVPTMCDEVIIVENSGSLYLGGPPLVKAATGEDLTSEELGGARVHCSISGCTDHFAESEQEAFEMARVIVASLNHFPGRTRSRMQSELPARDCSDEAFAELIPEVLDEKWPMFELIARIVDGSRFQQFKSSFGTHLVTGFARLAGYLIGVVANQGELDEKSAVKGAHFVRLCSLRDIPLVFLVNTPSDPEFLSLHGSPGKVAKARAQMMATLATSNVPKISIICGGSCGPSAYAMSGRAMQPHFMFSWPHARMGVATCEHADLDIKYITSNLIDDGCILPSETRKVIGQFLDISNQQHGNSNQPLPVLRM